MFFSSAPLQADRYRLVLDAGKLADDLGFRAVWVPERHFGDFGSIFPNPAVIAAHLAATTRRIEIRAGSVITPLHDIIRVAEEWSMVDNLSNGRVAISIGSGWNVNDFVLQPDRFEQRKEVMWDQFEELNALWRGEQIERRNGAGQRTEVGIRPHPVQPELPMWATSGGSPATYEEAGRRGTNVLTHLIAQDLPVLAKNIAAYRAARKSEGGIVTLMLHTYIGAEGEDVRAVVQDPLRDYLRSALSLYDRGRADKAAASTIDDAMVEELLDVAFDKYYLTGSLLGSPEKAAKTIAEVQEQGVDEIACLIDFGLPAEAVLGGLKRFAEHFLPGENR
ncbi:MupA/Atu3671 family FMN-dependent luciferase-like monooxygenase [Kribbella sp. NPDC051718]|uniref:MupA/Atu3671 family FMN-dependent luciferase-like monooxygenase n=1 Tax=Kribbella sp. NPDC051718 TaxID=3155168 RepID=UPI00344AA182